MHTDKQNPRCDERRLRAYLDQQLTAAEEAEVERHLDECPKCQRQIHDSAVEPQWWAEVSRYLTRDELDEPVGHSSAAAPADTPQGVAIRQITEWLDPADDPRYIGRFGGYEILGMIGHGGMGMVLKGFEPSLNRYVAIKLLGPALAATGAARKRFAREAQAAAAVLHENVIAIHRVDESHGLPYLVMPFLAGVSLQKRIDTDGPLPLTAILRIGQQIAQGLAAAHAQGLVHRDIKPANILLDRGVDRVTITDFGLARAADDGTITKTGMIAGTPQYMSPEQARGDAIDARSDLFSLGSVLYVMCTGHPPFRAETGYGILRRITDDQPRPIREINPEIPEWFEAVVHRLHAKAPDDRFRSAEEVAELLEKCLAHVQQPTVIPLPRLPVFAARDASEAPPDSGRSWLCGDAADGIFVRVMKWCRRRPRVAASIASLAVVSVAWVVVLFAIGNNAQTDRVASGRQSAGASSSHERNEPPGGSADRDRGMTNSNNGIDSLLQSLERDASKLEQRAAVPWDADLSRSELIRESGSQRFPHLEPEK